MSARSTCDKLLDSAWHDTDQSFEKLSHVITFKSTGQAVLALAHWQAALRYRDRAVEALQASMPLLASSEQLQSAKLLNRVHRVGLGMLMSALNTCLQNDG